MSWKYELGEDPENDLVCYVTRAAHLTLNEDNFGRIVRQNRVQVLRSLSGEHWGRFRAGMATEKIRIEGEKSEIDRQKITYAVSPQTKTGTPFAIVKCAA